ncbi:hypothetical protein M3Y99_01647500 [Aphelenchoides fujianensis]|nr:hypothetical protein M3Y99_01647500 [Aphelenchoides fujianensis]
MSTKQRGFVLCVEEQAGHRMAAVFLKSSPAAEVLLVREAEHEAALTPGNIVELVPPPILQPDFVHYPKNVLLSLYSSQFPKERVENSGLTQVLFKCHALLMDDPADDVALESPKATAVGFALDFGRFVITRDTQLPDGFSVRKDRLYAVWVGSHPRRQPESRLRRFGTILLAGRVEEAAQDVAKANALRDACPWKDALPVFTEALVPTESRIVPDHVLAASTPPFCSSAEDVVSMGLVVGEQSGFHDFFLPEGRIERVRLEGDAQVGRLYVATLRKPTDGVCEGAIVAACHQPPTRRVDRNLIEATLECAVQPRPAGQADALWSHWGRSALGGVLVPRSLLADERLPAAELTAVFVREPIADCHWIAVGVRPDGARESNGVAPTAPRVHEQPSGPAEVQEPADERLEEAAAPAESGGGGDAPELAVQPPQRPADRPNGPQLQLGEFFSAGDLDSDGGEWGEWAESSEGASPPTDGARETTPDFRLLDEDEDDDEPPVRLAVGDDDFFPMSAEERARPVGTRERRTLRLRGRPESPPAHEQPSANEEPLISFDEPPAVGEGAEAGGLPPLRADEPRGASEQPAASNAEDERPLWLESESGWSDDEPPVRIGFGDDDGEFFDRRSDDERPETPALAADNPLANDAEFQLLPGFVDFRTPEGRDFDPQRDVPTEHLQSLAGIQHDRWDSDGSDGEVSDDERHHEYLMDGHVDEAGAEVEEKAPSPGPAEGRDLRRRPPPDARLREAAALRRLRLQSGRPARRRGAAARRA